MMDIGSIIKSLAGGAKNFALVCTVDAVDKTARTIDCSPINEDAPLLGVNLQANQNSSCGVVAYPRVGSYVVVGFVAEGSAGVVLLTDEIESMEIVIGQETSAELTGDGIVFNGGNLGGLVKVEDVTKRFNLIEKDINDLKQVLAAGWTVASNDGGAALKMAATSWYGSRLVETKRTDLENKKVKQ